MLSGPSGVQLPWRGAWLGGCGPRVGQGRLEEEGSLARWSRAHGGLRQCWGRGQGPKRPRAPRLPLRFPCSRMTSEPR